LWFVGAWWLGWGVGWWGGGGVGCVVGVCGCVVGVGVAGGLGVVGFGRLDRICGGGVLVWLLGFLCCGGVGLGWWWSWGCFVVEGGGGVFGWLGGLW